MHSKYVFDPYPLSVTMQRMADNLKARRLEKKLSTKSLSAMSGVPASTIQRFELKHSISLESYVKLAKALGYTEEVMQLLSFRNQTKIPRKILANLPGNIYFCSEIGELGFFAANPLKKN